MNKNDKNEQWLAWLKELQSIAQNGLTYCKDPFCHARYEALQALTARIAGEYTQIEHTVIEDLLSKEYGYATPKIDLRGVIFKDNKILLVKEHSDGLWSLPGGWADVNESPAENVVREIQEETGFDAKAVRLLAFYDKHKHPHPPQFPHAYKCFFLCEIVGGKARPSMETDAIEFFARDALPPLSPHRVTKSQIQRMFELGNDEGLPTEFD